MTTAITIREYRSGDLPAIAALFHDTVHAVNSADYTPAQLDAWSPGDIDRNAWDESLSRHRTAVAIEPATGRIVGFGDIDVEHAHLDRLYVHKDYQRRRIATALCDRLEAYVPDRTITVHASITARPFFEHRGYAVVRGQQVRRHGVMLENYVMCRTGIVS